MSDKWTLYYEDGSRATENSWPTEGWADYMAQMRNDLYVRPVIHVGKV